MIASEIFAIIVTAATILGILTLTESGRHLPRGLLLALAFTCVITLIAMLMSDWPFGVLADFWASHNVLSSVVSTVLLAGIGFLAFRVHDSQVQAELDESVTAAGMGGVVDHVVEIEVALAMACAAAEPDSQIWIDWSNPRRTLGWLRDRRDALPTPIDGRPIFPDPRCNAYSVPGPTAAEVWRIDLLDQCVRRVIGGVRDWAPTLSRSRNGQRVLVDLASLRTSLLRAQMLLQSGDYYAAWTEMIYLRCQCREMALALEIGSRSNQPRGEVLKTIDPLPRDYASTFSVRASDTNRNRPPTWAELRIQASNTLIG